MSKYSKYIDHIQHSLVSNASRLGPEQIRNISDYMGTKHRMLGVSTQKQKELAKNKYGLELEPDELFPVMDLAFKKSKVYEVKSAALLLTEYNFKTVNHSKLYETMITWVDHVDNWGHSDNLSKFYTRFLEMKEFKKDFISELKNWNKDPNPWKRRQSMVALLYYARTKNEHLPFKSIISMISSQLEAKEYFVQKGLGWTLRESYNVYPDLTYKFVLDNFHLVSPVAFTAAIEKMTEKEKSVLKQKRKAHRAKK
jgi:3-methyladenine DNA glycosylase AlkD